MNTDESVKSVMEGQDNSTNAQLVKMADLFEINEEI